MIAAYIRGGLRLVAIVLESLNVASPGTFENILGDADIEPLFILVITEAWYWFDERRKKRLDKLS